MPIKATICLIRKDGNLLLLRRAPGRFGGGKWDAPGGKLRPGESPEECTVREVAEETGLRIVSPIFHGSFNVYFGHRELDWIVHVFSASRFAGRLQASAEGVLRWFPEDQLPYEQMWPSDQHWLPAILAGHRLEATFWFDDKAERLLDHAVRID